MCGRGLSHFLFNNGSLGYTRLSVKISLSDNACIPNLHLEPLDCNSSQNLISSFALHSSLKLFM